MKTNVILRSSDRRLFGVTIKQQTKGEFLSVSDLQKAFEVGKWQNGWAGQTYNQLLHTESAAKKCYSVLKECDLIDCDISKFMELVEKETLLKVLKKLGVWKVTGRGDNRSVMTHPYIWMTIALELNYALYGKVIKWLTDTLVFDRIEAGSEYRPMNAAIKGIVRCPDYPKYARLINQKVFGEHQTGMRNLASASELRRIADIEKFVTQGIQMGMITHERGIEKAIKLYK